MEPSNGLPRVSVEATVSLKQELRNQSREAQWQMERGTLHLYISLCNLYLTSYAETKIHVHCRCKFSSDEKT